MFLVSIILFIFCPVLSIPLVIFGLAKDKKYRLVYLSLIAILIALFAYQIAPDVEEDLYRHQIDSTLYAKWSIGELIDFIPRTTEQITMVYKFFIGKTENLGLLQFFSTALSYFIIFYVLNYYTNKHSTVANWKKVSVWVFTVTSFSFITIAGNIFCNLALEIFALGLFLKYEKGRKIISKILYIIPIFIHTSTIFILALYLLFYILGRKVTVRNATVLILLIVSIGYIIPILSENLNFPIINELTNFYISYFNNEQEWVSLHSTDTMIIYLLKMLPYLLCLPLLKKRDEMGELSIFVCIAIIALIFQTSFSIRYIPIASLCGITLLFNSFEHKKYGDIMAVLLYALAIPQIIFQIPQIISRDFGDVGSLITSTIMFSLSGGA